MASSPNRPIVATPVRLTLMAAIVFAVALFVGLRLRHLRLPLGVTNAAIEIPLGAIVAFALFAGLLVILNLRGEEARLMRQLRTARTGTAALRRLAIEKKKRFSTGLGVAALHLASGDRHSALDALASGSPWLTLGRVSELRAILDADAARATDTESERAEAIATLRTIAPTGNIEVDRYRIHVLVKAILEHGDLIAARDIAHELSSDPDEDARIYVVWLRAWFAFDHLPAPTDVERRLALLLARNHGATDLAVMLAETPEKEPDS